MWRLGCIFTLAFLRALAAAQAPDSASISTIERGQDAPRRTENLEIRSSVVGPNDIHNADHSGRPHTVYGALEYVHEEPLARSVMLRTGFAWQRMDFGGTEAPIPGCLQSTAVVLGADVFLNHKFGFRLEIRPGVYSDFESVGWSDCDVPTLLGCQYLYSPNIRLFAGVRFSALAEYPVLPMVGAIIQFSEKLSLDLLYPDIKFEYRPSEHWAWNLGISFMSGNFRTHMDRLDDGDERLHDAVVNYFESRPTAGVVYRGFGGIDLFANAGVVMGRQFEYFRAGKDVVIGGAPFLELGMRARF